MVRQAQRGRTRQVYHAVVHMQMEWFNRRMGAGDTSPAPGVQDAFPIGEAASWPNSPADDIRAASSLVSGQLLQYLTTTLLSRWPSTGVHCSSSLLSLPCPFSSLPRDSPRHSQVLALPTNVTSLRLQHPLFHAQPLILAHSKPPTWNPMNPLSLRASLPHCQHSPPYGVLPWGIPVRHDGHVHRGTLVRHTSRTPG